MASGQTRSVVSKAVGMAGATMVAGGAMQQAGGVLTSTGGAVRRKRPLLIAALIGLIMLIVIGSAALALFVFAGQSSATITLTPQSHIVQTSYLVTATTGTVNFSQGQVQARTLTSTISLHQSGQASGFFAGVHASGLITFRNISTGCGCPVVIPAGTVFTSGSGITVVIDTAASVASLCSVTVHAHAVNFGPSGNIKAGDVNTSYSPTMLVTNPVSFSGGQAGQSHSVVQQSDINKLSSVLQSQVVQTAQAGISSQLQSHEHLLNAPTCQTQTSADHPAGSVATSVNVTVSTTCTAEAYDYTGAVQWTQQQVQNQALTYFSSTFALVGTVQTQIKSATLVDAQTGKILLEVSAKGTWSYHFSQRMKQTLAAAIHGRDINEARALLANYDGIAGVSIAVAGFDQSKLPSDTSKITIVVKN